MKPFKFVSLLLILIMMVLMVSACGNDQEPDTIDTKDDQVSSSTDVKKETEDKDDTAGSDVEHEVDLEDKTRFAGQEMSFYMFEGGYGKEYQETLIASFQEEYDVTIELVTSPKMEEVLRPKLITGDVPDLIMYNWGPNGIVESVFKEEGFYDLTEIFEKPALDSDEKLKDLFLPGFLESKKVAPYGDGKIYVAPLFYSGMGLVYNKTYFAENGIEPPKTWDEFFALGDVAAADGRALYTYQGIYPSYNEMLINPAIASAVGAEGFADFTNYEEGSFKNDIVKQVLQNVQDIANNGYLMEGTVALNHTQAQTDMMMGKSLFVPCGGWIEGEMTEADREDGFEFALAAPPTLNVGDDSYAQAFMDQIWIPKNAKNPELAAEFLRYMYTREAQMIAAEKANGLLPLKGSVDYCTPVMSEAMIGFYRMFETSKPLFVDFTPLPAGSKVNVVKEIYDNNLTAVINGEKTVDEWMDSVEKVFAEAREDIENQ